MSGRPTPSARYDASDSGAARAGRLGLIVLLHASFFLLLQGGLAQSPAPATTPKTVFVTFVAPEPQPVQQIRPAEPKPEPKPVEPPPPPKPKPKPQPKPKPAEKQITQEIKPEPPADPAPPESSAPPEPSPPAQPAAPVPAAAPAPAAPPGPPTPPAPPKPKTLTSGIAYLYNPAPQYPALSRRLGEEGTVVLRVLVNERGLPERVEVQTSSDSSRLDDAARQTVMKYRFKPHVEDGRPVPVYAIIPISFRLD